MDTSKRSLMGVRRSRKKFICTSAMSESIPVYSAFFTRQDAAAAS